MEHNHTGKEKKTLAQEKGHFPKAAVQSGENRDMLSGNGKAITEECQPRGNWLQLFCPDDNCLSEAERIKLLNFCEENGEQHDHWLEVFCPDGSCEISEPSQLP